MNEDLKKKYHTFNGVGLPAMMRVVGCQEKILIIAVADDECVICQSGIAWHPDKIEPLPDIYMVELSMEDIKPGDELMSPLGYIYHGFVYGRDAIYATAENKLLYWELKEYAWKIRSIGEDWRLCEKEANS